MRLSQLLFQTQRAGPSTRLPGHQLLLRSGLIRPLAPRSYALMPLGLRIRRKIEQAARDAMLALGGQEIFLPVLDHPLKGIFDSASARAAEATSDRDRDPSDQAQRPGRSGPDGEMAVLATVRGIIQSYRQLPVVLYCSRHGLWDGTGGAGGLFGAREPCWLDVYSLHAGQSEIEDFYPRIQESLTGALERCGVEAVVAQADLMTPDQVTGHSLKGIFDKWVFSLPGGEEKVIRCGVCGYAADQAIARARRVPAPAEEMLPMQDVETPDCRTIADLAAYLGIPRSRTAKALFMVADIEGQGDQSVFAVVRGDTDLNEAKLRRLIRAKTIGPATEAEVRALGAEPGYGSPVGLQALVVVDELVARSPNLVAGANRTDYHTLNVNYGRDYLAAVVADIALAEAGDPCPMCSATVSLEDGVELVQTAILGDTYSRMAGANYVDHAGEMRPLALGCYRFHTDRVMAAIAESHFDSFGLVWPSQVAPCQVYLMTVGKSNAEVSAAADRLYADLSGAGMEVLYDDRDERAGVKFNDADLLGIPVRVGVGERGLKGGMVEVKRRGSGTVENVTAESLIAYLQESLRS